MANPQHLRVRQTFYSDNDMHLALGSIVNRPAAQAAIDIDAAADRKWFRKHRKANVRTRPASTRELAATGLPQGCTVQVSRGPHGSQIRLILLPETEKPAS